MNRGSIFNITFFSGEPEILYEDKYDDTLMLKAGGAIVLPVSITGHPRPTVKWFHGDKELIQGNGTTIETNEKSSTLTVKGISAAKNSGNYRVEAENKVGSDSAEFTVKIKGINMECVCTKTDLVHF